MIASFLEHASSRVSQIYHQSVFCEGWRTALPWTGLGSSICFATNEKYLGIALANPNITGIIIPADTFANVHTLAQQCSKGIVVALNPSALFYSLHLALGNASAASRYAMTCGIHSTAQIHPTAVIEEGVHIGKGVHIGEYTIVREKSIIDDGTWVGAHCIIGEDALLTEVLDNHKTHITHFGGVHIGTDCRLYGHNIILKSAYLGEFTTIGQNTFLGVQTTVGHDALLGKNITASAKVTVAGRATIGNNVWLGASACISNTVTIGDNATIAIGSVVITDVPPGAKVSGNFAMPHQKNLYNYTKACK